MKLKLKGYVNLWIDPILREKRGGKDQRYTGKEDSKSKFVPICYHIWTIIDLLEIINGCFGIVQSETDDEFRQDVEFLPTI